MLMNYTSLDSIARFDELPLAIGRKDSDRYIGNVENLK